MASQGGNRPASVSVLSCAQARPLLGARKRGEAEFSASADLGLTETAVSLSPVGVTFPGTMAANWHALEQVAEDDNGCYEVCGDRVERIQVMSEVSGRLASLYPTDGPPALLLSGTLMHRIREINPAEDTRCKLAPLGRLKGARLLDTATGLGYTAIEAARLGATVVTVELDPAVEEVTRRNPWSAALFDNPNIDCRSGDVADEIVTFEAGAFDAILHDPPVLELAGDLYGADFYGQLRRVLRSGGRLFHYIGNPHSRSGARHHRGVLRRLKETGFCDVRRRPEAFGVSAR